MGTKKKKCPKCNVEMEENAVMFGIPALNDPKKMPSEQVNTKIAAPVRVFRCPQCQLVEMYAVADPTLLR